ISTSMKLSLAIPLLLAATIQVNAFTFAQRITLEKKNAKLSTVLKDIQRQSGYNIFYSESLVANRNRVSVDLKNATVELALKHVLAEQDRKSTRLNSSHVKISYAVFCLKKKKKKQN